LQVKRIECFRTIVVLFLVLLSMAAVADERRTLRAGFLDFPPFKYMDEQGQAAGPWVELSERLAKDAGYHLEWEQLPISRIYRYLQSGEIDFWPGVADIPILRGAVFETRSTPLSLALSAYHLDETPPVHTIDDLAGEKLILIAGFSYMGLLDHLRDDGTTEIARTPNHKPALQMLVRGRGSYLINYDEPLEDALREVPLDNLRQSPLIVARGAFIVSRKTDGADDIVQDFDNAYEAIRDRGEARSFGD